MNKNKNKTAIRRIVLKRKYCVQFGSDATVDNKLFSKSLKSDNHVIAKEHNI